MTNERTNEQTQAAINPAGELPALPKPAVPAMQRGYPGMQPSYTQPDYYTAEQIRERDAMWQAKLDALAASHRERSGQGVSNGANCAQGNSQPAVAHGRAVAWLEWDGFSFSIAYSPTNAAPRLPVGRYDLYTAPPSERSERGAIACGDNSQPADKPAGQADNSQATPARGTDAWPNGEYRLWDSQWMNVVNFDRGYESFDKEDAVNHAVKLTEKYMRENIQRAALSEAKRSHVSGDTLAPEPATPWSADPPTTKPADVSTLDWITSLVCEGRNQWSNEVARGGRQLDDTRLDDTIAKVVHAGLWPSQPATPAAAVPDGLLFQLRAVVELSKSDARDAFVVSATSWIERHGETLISVLATAPANISQPQVAHSLPASEVAS